MRMLIRDILLHFYVRAVVAVVIWAFRGFFYVPDTKLNCIFTLGWNFVGFLWRFVQWHLEMDFLGSWFGSLDRSSVCPRVLSSPSSVRDFRNRIQHKGNNKSMINTKVSCLSSLFHLLLLISLHSIFFKYSDIEKFMQNYLKKSQAWIFKKNKYIFKNIVVRTSATKNTQTYHKLTPRK